MPGLGITCGQLRREIGHYLGFDRDPDNWSSNETQDVWDVIDSGLRTFYRPPRLEGEAEAYQWSFLKPQLTIQLRTGVDEYLMPEDFAGFEGGLYFVNENNAQSRIQLVNEGRILQLREQTWNTLSLLSPACAAIVPVPADEIVQQRYKLLIWPRPDAAYTIRCIYLARQDGLRNDNTVPAGGQEHAETILASCLAAAARKCMDEDLGSKDAWYRDQVRASMDFDRRANSPRTLGYMGDPGVDQHDFPGYPRSIGGLVTLEAYPVDGGGGGGEGEPPTSGIQTQSGQPLVTQGGQVIVPQ